MKMTKIRIVDEIQLPSDTTTVRYTGKDPYVVCTMARELLRDIMKITGKDIWETDVRWDVSGDPRDFYGVWKGKRKDDAWSVTTIRLLIQGAQSSKDKMGWVEIRFKGSCETSYDYNNFIQRGFWWFYNYTFYFKQKRQYLDLAKDNVLKIRQLMMERLGIYRQEF